MVAHSCVSGPVSLLSPNQCKFIMIDPKRIELSTYRKLVGYHLITSPNIEEYVMTTPENAVAVLHAALAEMERRYDVFSRATVRNLEEYHNKCNSDSSLEKMPFIVVLQSKLPPTIKGVHIFLNCSGI